MLPRTLEPEVMDTVEDATDYDRMDHSAVNRSFVDEFLAAWNECPASPPVPLAGARLIDLGTGTAQIPIELAGRRTGCRILAVDLAGEMLKLARRNVAEAAVEETVEIEQVDAKALPWDDGQFDGVISNSIIHHIAEPAGVLDEMVRVLKPGGMLFVRDLVREYAGNASPHARQLFHQSFHAALTLEETRQMVADRGGRSEFVQASSDRHWTISGRWPIR